MQEGPEDTDPTRAADVADAMRVLARERFLPADQHPHAHEDRPLPLWHGQTSSQPSTVASMLRLLEVPVGARVLDVGSGSGWTTALLARLVGPGGAVLGLELDPELAGWGAGNLAACDLPWARIEPATPGSLGRPVDGGWDRILVSASPRSLPEVLVDQLAEGGRMVIPVRSTMHLVERTAGRTRVTTHGSYTFVPLR
ncbi:protein-L-isoaspartate O-methyltransferase family protein [Cellulomonas xylanilytica]|uniref:Protein-L-isoaspartate O-methyltransferase n=1 Tax=Cellulomonas xylanilytica TaxID=233583 RepID=A0A510V956_9CELL|nr:protein-L-isoaspartate O-methyltransferase [Cellulomonas xylanilytica]GEK22501.1 fibrillarin-like rRNA methylase [Cellulomonas xylanilytica]